MTERAGVICAGNWIVDLVHDIETWPNESELTRIGQQTRGIGGGAANVIAALARLQTGLPLFPMGAIGDDEQGAFILQECQGLGLPTEALIAKPGVATAHTHVMSVAGQSRTFFYQGGANDALTASDFPLGTFSASRAKIFYLGYLTLLGDLDAPSADGATNAAQVLSRAQQAGLITCVDLVSIQHPRFQEIVAAAAPHIDYLVTNEIEVAHATGQEPSGRPEDLLKSARKLLDRGVNAAVVVHCVDTVLWVGADGKELAFRVEKLPPDQIASHLGAGDAFCAGLLYGVHEAQPPQRCLDLATATARASLKGLTATEAIPSLDDLEHMPLEPLGG